MTCEGGNCSDVYKNSQAVLVIQKVFHIALLIALFIYNF